MKVNLKNGNLLTKKIENKIQFIFPEKVLKNFPLNDNVLKLINKEYILKNYEHNEYNHDYFIFRFIRT